MKTILIATVAFCIISCGRAQPITAVYGNKNSRIDSLLKATYSDTLPGASIAVINNGKVIFRENYGVSGISAKEKISSFSNFNIASLTKQFTALAILQLESQHLLSINDKLSLFFPQMNKKVANAITIKQLLTHSSGIMDHYNYANTSNLKHAYNADVYKAIKAVDTTYFTPGTQFRYSNTAYCLLALIIEKLSGEIYSHYMTNNIFKKAGMSATKIWNQKENITKEVTGYAWDSASARFKISGPGESIFFSTEGDGGIYTSVNDYIKWFNALQSGKIFSPNIVQKARTIEYAINKENKLGYGFGWFIEESASQRKVYHSGSNGGFRTFSFSIPAENNLVIIFSNRDDIDLESLVQKIVQIQWQKSKPFTKIEVLTSMVREPYYPTDLLQDASL